MRRFLELAAVFAFAFATLLFEVTMQSSCGSTSAAPTT